MNKFDEIWKQYDGDKDGQLSRAEAKLFFRAYYKTTGHDITDQACDQLFTIIDKHQDPNGLMSKEEFRKEMGRSFPNLLNM